MSSNRRRMTGIVGVVFGALLAPPLISPLASPLAHRPGALETSVVRCRQMPSVDYWASDRTRSRDGTCRRRPDGHPNLIRVVRSTA